MPTQAAPSPIPPATFSGQTNHRPPTKETATTATPTPNAISDIPSRRAGPSIGTHGTDGMYWSYRWSCM
ncbi:hypothetical protein KZX45_07290 [Georgenia sp. EYE_87]|uniref:hypothetical protein n=1 Tax=Georgenia sp. EYE_87 TaxID=2853448 RepID=UPI002004A6E8|nr:hypothetical protein [Georgenia sp. EYE_87]MCK6210346.1 hypothetical protein [Georgenia sp. EYE_87]